MKRLIIAISALLFLTGCSSTNSDPLPVNSSNSASSEELEPSSLDGLVFTTYSLPESKFYDHVEAIKLETKKGADSVTITIANTINEWVATQIAEFEANSKEAYKNEKYMGKVNEYNLSYDESAISDLIFAVTFTDYRFEGGAHGSSVVKTFAFNKTNGETISLISQVDSSKRTEFNTAVANALGSQAGTFGETIDDKNTLIANLNNDEYFEGWFASKEDGVAIIFPEYSVGPYSSGQPAIALTWDEIAQYFNSDSILLSEFNK